MKIAVGTVSDQKLGYLKEVLDELNIEAILAPISVASDVSDQPISHDETKNGSINRAKNALAECNDADVSLGIEVGYHPNSNGDYKMLCWATITDKTGRMVSTSSHELLLPRFYQQVIKDEKNMCDSIVQYMDENTDDLSQKLGLIIRYRKPFIQMSIRLALFEYFIDN